MYLLTCDTSTYYTKIYITYKILSNTYIEREKERINQKLMRLVTYRVWWEWGGKKR